MSRFAPSHPHSAPKKSENLRAYEEEDASAISSKPEVQFIAVADAPPTRRGRGAPVGNQNRLLHGRYSKRFLLRRAHIRGLLRDARIVIAVLNAAAKKPA